MSDNSTTDAIQASLLRQEVESLKNDAKQAKQDIERLREDLANETSQTREKSLDEARDARKSNSVTVRVMLAGFGFASLVAGWLFKEDIAELKGGMSAFASKGALQDVKDRKIKLEDRYSEHLESMADYRLEIEARMQAVEQRVAAIELDIGGDNDTFQQIISRQSEYGGKIERVLLLNTKLEDRVVIVEGKATGNERGIAAVAASAGANFVEVESQMRGLNAYLNAVLAQRWGTLQTSIEAIDKQFSLVGSLLRDAGERLDIDLGVPLLPEVDYYNDNIPASAVTTPGQIRTNGNH